MVCRKALVSRGSKMGWLPAGLRLTLAVPRLQKIPLTIILLGALLLAGCADDDNPAARDGYFLLSSLGTLWQLPPGSESFGLLGGILTAPQVLTGDSQMQLLTCITTDNCLALLNPISLGYSCLYPLPINSEPSALTWVPPDRVWWLKANGQQIGGIDLEDGLPQTVYSPDTPELAALAGVTVAIPTVNGIVLQPGDLLALTVSPSGQAQLYRLRPLTQISEVIGPVPSLAPVALLPEGRLVGCATDSDHILAITLADLSVDTLAFVQPVINPVALTWLEKP